MQIMASKRKQPIFGAPKGREPTMTNYDEPRDLDQDAYRSVEQAAEDAIAQASEGRETLPTEPATDPAPLPSHVARDRSFQLVDNIGSAVGLQLRDLRNQIDALTQEMNEQRDMIRDAIVGYAEFAETAMAQKQIIGDAIKNLHDSFAAGKRPLPPGRRV